MGLKGNTRDIKVDTHAMQVVGVSLRERYLAPDVRHDLTYTHPQTHTEHQLWVRLQGGVLL